MEDTTRRGPASEQPVVRKAEVGQGAIAQYHMINHGDAQERAGLDQPLREGAILATGLGIAADVVMATEDGGRVGQDGGFSRVGCWRGDFRSFSISPPPNRACTFQRTRLSSSLT